jgi:hypothetical protein
LQDFPFRVIVSSLSSSGRSLRGIVDSRKLIPTPGRRVIDQ